MKHTAGQKFHCNCKSAGVPCFVDFLEVLPIQPVTLTNKYLSMCVKAPRETPSILICLVEIGTRAGVPGHVFDQ